VASVDGTPMLWKNTTLNGTTVGSAPLTGFTSLSDINASERYLTGGWPMAVFHSEPPQEKLPLFDARQELALYEIK